MQRCEWAGTDTLMVDYHDKEWGVPVHNDQKLFEFLILEAFQAGLSWSTVLKKRENFRMAFDNFDANTIAKYNEKKVQKLISNPGIIRNKLKIKAAITNARAFLAVQKEFGSFDKYIWKFANKKHRTPTSVSQIPATSDESDAISKELRKRGFRFVGSTICYAFMQATGMTNDHLKTCFRNNSK
ncbi:MAG: DNA-3-methyladenine glycosylase I [Candidatus Aenigmarchaeota archaeon]|nr:DNA-3-methyladenine glycosylase I [Candidatus Aenigmarchaeota archaeon]